MRPKPPVPLWRWALWWGALGIAIVLFYVLLTPLWMGLRAAAWLSLCGFVGLTLFLVAAQIWTDRTIAIALRLTRGVTGFLHKVPDVLFPFYAGMQAAGDRRRPAKRAPARRRTDQEPTCRRRRDRPSRRVG